MYKYIFFEDAKDYPYFEKNHSPAELDYVNDVLKAYHDDIITIDIPRDENEEIIFDDVFVDTSKYPQARGLEETIVKWYEDLEDTGYLSKLLNKIPEKLFGVSEGIVCQQCNCHGAYGAGISGAISEKYPEVEKSFYEEYAKNKGNQFGTYTIVSCDDKLKVANIYSQDGYGNGIKNGKQYTDVDKLVTAIRDICKENPNSKVYVPHAVDANGKHGGIGCGLAGAKWEEVYSRLQDICLLGKINNLYLLDTFACRQEKVKAPEINKEKKFQIER